MSRFQKLKLSCVMILVIAMLTVSPTLAWLSAGTEPVVNYFSGGDIAIKLDEAPVDVDGKRTDGDRVQENRYKYTAGAALDKDPTVTVLKGSEDCYVYVCVENQLPEALFTLDIDEAVWIPVAQSGDCTIYRYYAVVEYSTQDQALTPVFTAVTVSAALTSADVKELGARTLTVTAFAIQSAGMERDTADSLAVAYFFDGVALDALLPSTEEDAEDTAGKPTEETAEEVIEEIFEEITEPVTEEPTADLTEITEPVEEPEEEITEETQTEEDEVEPSTEVAALILTQEAAETALSATEEEPEESEPETPEDAAEAEDE